MGSELHPVIPCAGENPFLLFFLSWGSIVRCKQENGADRNVFHVLPVLGEREAMQQQDSWKCC